MFQVRIINLPRPIYFSKFTQDPSCKQVGRFYDKLIIFYLITLPSMKKKNICRVIIISKVDRRRLSLQIEGHLIRTSPINTRPSKVQHTYKTIKISDTTIAFINYWIRDINCLIGIQADYNLKSPAGIATELKQGPLSAACNWALLIDSRSP